jgi:hypothetical protein
MHIETNGHMWRIYGTRRSDGHGCHDIDAWYLVDWFKHSTLVRGFTRWSHRTNFALSKYGKYAKRILFMLTWDPYVNVSCRVGFNWAFVPSRLPLHFKTKLRAFLSASEVYRPSGRRLSDKLVPPFVGRGCCASTTLCTLMFDAICSDVRRCVLWHATLCILICDALCSDLRRYALWYATLCTLICEAMHSDMRHYALWYATLCTLTCDAMYSDVRRFVLWYAMLCTPICDAMYYNV